MDVCYAPHCLIRLYVIRPNRFFRYFSPDRVFSDIIRINICIIGIVSFDSKSFWSHPSMPPRLPPPQTPPNSNLPCILGCTKKCSSLVVIVVMSLERQLSFQCTCYSFRSCCFKLYVWIQVYSILYCSVHLPFSTNMMSCEKRLNNFCFDFLRLLLKLFIGGRQTYRDYNQTRPLTSVP